MALRILGIDLGTHALKVAELRSSFRSVELVALHRATLGAPTPSAPGAAAAGAGAGAVAGGPSPQPGSPEPGSPEPGSPEPGSPEVTSLAGIPAGAGPVPLAAPMAALAALAPQLGRTEVVVVALPGPGAATHRLRLPLTDARRLEQALGFEVEGLIPFDLAEVLFDYELLAQTPARAGQPGHSELLVGVARRRAVGELLSGMGALGFDPRIVTLPGLALAQLPLPAAGVDAVLDLGHTRIGFLARADGRPTFARTIDGGGQRLTAALARLRGLGWADAEALKHQSSLLRGDPQLRQALAKSLAPAIRELRQTLKQVAGLERRPVERLWLTGGTALLDGLPELLGQELGIAAEPLPAPKLAGAPLAPEAASFAALALGLALRGHATGRGVRFNLRRGDHSFQGDFAKVRGRLLRAAAIAAALAVGFGVRAYAEVHLLAKREQQIDEAICAQTKQAVGKCVKDATVAKSLLAAGGGSGESVIPEQSAVGLLAETSSRLAVDGAKMTELEVAYDQLLLRGTADSFETVDKVVAALKGYRCFADVQRGRVQKGRDAAAQIEFNLSVRNDCLGANP